MSCFVVRSDRRNPALYAWLGFLPLSVFAQSTPFFPNVTPNDAIERRQEQRQEAARQQAQARPDVLSPALSPEAGELSALPSESPCFPIRAVGWEGAEAFADLSREADVLIGQCVGAQGLQAVRNYFAARLVSQGFVTTRMLIPGQNLAAGTLRLQIVPGRIEHVQSEESIGWWRMALLAGPGDLINQRDLDQALENIRRLQSQADAAIDLVPGAHPGESDVVLKPGNGKRWHGLLTADNAGLKTTGKNQLGGTFTLDSPLFLYDSLSLSANSNADFGNGAAGTRSSSINYNLPLGYWNVFFSANQSRYKQTVAGFGEDIVYGGRSSQVETGLGYVPFRNTSGKTSLSAKVFRKRASTSINDLDLPVQHRDFVGYELGGSHRQYFGSMVVDLGASWRASLPQASKAPGFVLDEPEWNGKFELLLANASLTAPFQLAGQTFRYQGTFRLQQARSRILSSEYFVIGNRYSVRGFDEQLTLAAESGRSLRNDLAWQIGDTGQEFFAGLDVGRVSGPSAQFLAGKTLIGAVVGARGRWRLGQGAALSYELSVGQPVHKPEYFKTHGTNVAAQVGLEF